MRNPDGTGLFVGDVGAGLVDGPELIDGRSLAEGVVAAGLLVGPDSTDGIGLIEGDVRTGLEDGPEESEGLGDLLRMFLENHGGILVMAEIKETFKKLP